MNRSTKLLTKDVNYKAIKGMWTDNTRKATIKGGPNRREKILNGYENIDSNIFLKIKESKITIYRT